MKTARNNTAFTLVELLVALIVTGIILSAVATLAFAMSTASRAGEDAVLGQAQLRQARLRIGELVRHCRLICAAPGNDLVVWYADGNADGQINVNELVYIERGDDLNTLRLCQFAAADGAPQTLESLSLPATKAQLVSSYSETYASLVANCNNVQFGFDAAPPFTRLLRISFGLTTNGTAHPYEIAVALRGWAGNLLNEAGDALVSDDD